MPAWELIARDVNGVLRAFLEPKGLTYTRRLNAASTLAFQHDLNAKTLELRTLDRAVVAYRDGVVRHNGPVVPPYPVRRPRLLEVQSQDAWYYLTWRRLQAEEIYGSTALGEIAAGLLATQNARGTTHLRMGAIAAAPAADQIYAEGQIVSDLMVTTLCEIDPGGVWLRVDPVDEDEVMGALTVLYPDSGVFRAEARFEFGDGTLANLTDYEVQHGQVRNHVVALGASFGTSNGSGQEAAPAADAGSQARYGLFDDEVSFTAEDDTVALDKHAADELDPEPKTILSVTPQAADAAAANKTFTPMLFDHFDVGDVVPVYIRDGAYELEAAARVTEASVAIADQSGKETLTGLTLEVIG